MIEFNKVKQFFFLDVGSSKYFWENVIAFLYIKVKIHWNSFSVLFCAVYLSMIIFIRNILKIFSSCLLKLLSKQFHPNSTCTMNLKKKCWNWELRHDSRIIVWFNLKVAKTVVQFHMNFFFVGILSCILIIEAFTRSKFRIFEEIFSLIVAVPST